MFFSFLMTRISQFRKGLISKQVKTPSHVKFPLIIADAASDRCRNPVIFIFIQSDCDAMRSDVSANSKFEVKQKYQRVYQSPQMPLANDQTRCFGLRALHHFTQKTTKKISKTASPEIETYSNLRVVFFSF